ncbi:MAG: hypothetical protein AAGA85_13290 [Bacteroidota bacterium]
MIRERRVAVVFGWIYLLLGIAFLLCFFIYPQKGQEFLNKWQTLFGTKGMWELDIVVFNFILLASGISLIFVGIARIRRAGKE